MNIAILGAPGCLGRNLIIKLLEAPDNFITGSYMSEKEIPLEIPVQRVKWQKVDLSDTSSTEAFMSGCDVLIYLIHSLTSKNFRQLDLQLANATGKAANKTGVKRIIYMGGIVPADEKASPHLTSRAETGKELASHGIPVAEIRASILLGTCSASYQIVYYLAKRLPLMVTPKWLNSLCAPIALEDAVTFINALLYREIKGHEIFEIGSDIIRYRDLLTLCGKSIHGVRNTIIPVPFFSIKLSSLWIQLITGIPNTVGTALAEGLRTNTIPTNNRFKEITGKDPIPLETVLSELAKKMAKKK